MTQYLNPWSGRQFIDANGNPYVGAKLFSYVSGSSTKTTLTKDSAGSSNHTNPIILNAKGEPADGGGASQAMWQSGGVSVKLVLAAADDTDPPLSPISTWDNITGINDTTVTIDQWIAGPAPTYISGTQFTLVGDQTTIFHVGRRVKTLNSGGSIYGTITASAYTSLTTVTVANDSGSMDSGLSNVWYGLISSVNGSSPGGDHYEKSNFLASNTFTPIQFFTAGIGPDYIQNIGIDPSVASKALTVALKTKALADPSATDKVEIAFRNATATTGDYVVRQVTAATSVIAPSGATLGFAAAQAGYVYVYALDNAGTVELAVSGSLFDEGLPQSTTAIGTGSDSLGVLYSTSARTGVAIRLIAVIAITTGTVAGEWDNAPTKVKVANLPQGPRVIAEGGGSAATFNASITFPVTINAEVGDIIIASYRAAATRNAAEFVHGLLLSHTGTCVIQYTSGTNNYTMPLLSTATYGASLVENECSVIGRVTTSGTLTAFGCTAISTIGTASTNRTSYVYAQVIRGLRQ